jgi:hypothetical protein
VFDISRCDTWRENNSTYVDEEKAMLNLNIVVPMKYVRVPRYNPAVCCSKKVVLLYVAFC